MNRTSWGDLEVRRFSYFAPRSQQRFRYRVGLRETQVLRSVELPIAESL